eukprot:356861-Chlamydomonas_euryale.AAC.5
MDHGRARKGNPLRPRPPGSERMSVQEANAWRKMRPRAVHSLPVSLKFMSPTSGTKGGVLDQSTATFMVRSCTSRVTPPASINPIGFATA